MNLTPSKLQVRMTEKLACWWVFRIFGVNDLPQSAKPHIKLILGLGLKHTAKRRGADNELRVHNSHAGQHSTQRTILTKQRQSVVHMPGNHIPSQAGFSPPYSLQGCKKLTLSVMMKCTTNCQKRPEWLKPRTCFNFCWSRLHRVVFLSIPREYVPAQHEPSLHN